MKIPAHKLNQRSMFPGSSTDNDKYILISREAGLSALALGEGLTAMRKADFVKHAYATHSFFSLSIGMERLMKLILIYDYRLENNNQFPGNSYLKKFGHNILGLFEKSKTIADKNNLQDLYAPVVDDEVCMKILTFLNDFAIKTRYYNLDVLTDTVKHTADPLKDWEENINNIIVLRHYRPNKKYNDIVDAISGVQTNIFFSFHDYSGNPVTTMQDFYGKGHQMEVCRKYSMFYTFKIIRFLSKLIDAIDNNTTPPYICEYFKAYTFSDDKYILSRKTWGPYAR